jgi:hypothetical protein
MEDQKLLDALDRLSGKIDSLDTVRDDIHKLNADVKSLRDRFASITILTPEEISFLRSAMRAKRAERDFWYDQKTRLVGAGLLAAATIVCAALWHYITSLLSGGGS